MKIIGVMLLVVGMSGAAMGIPTGVPEIDAGSAVNGLLLFSGALLVIKSRRKK
jgi:hypothetical protein